MATKDSRYARSLIPRPGAPQVSKARVGVAPVLSRAGGHLILTLAPPRLSALRHFPMTKRTAPESMLDLVRLSHRMAREAKSGADRKWHMKMAQRAGKTATPHIFNAELRRRVVSNEPMSEEEWERFGGPSVL
jgi:hypothetical protein